MSLECQTVYEILSEAPSKEALCLFYVMTWTSPLRKGWQAQKVARISSDVREHLSILFVGGANRFATN